MPLSNDQLKALLTELADLQTTTDPATLNQESRDYYWYSPILDEQLKDKSADLIVRPTTEADVIRVAAWVARLGVPLTVRGGGTGNYGQCVPLQGGVLMDITGLNKVLAISPGKVRCEAGILIKALEDAVGATNQALLMYPSTRDIATIGGFIAGGYAGVGSIRHGILKDTGNVSLIRVVTLEAQPRIIELRDADIQKVHHAFGTNGIITELELAIRPKVEWLHHVSLFDSYAQCCAFGVAASTPDLDLFLLTSVDARFAPFYTVFGAAFPEGKHAMFAMVNPAHLEAYEKLAKSLGGQPALCATEQQLHQQGLPPAFECAYNHTTLMALKVDRSYTYLQIAYPQPFDPALVQKQMDRYGDELLMHHEFSQQFGGYVVFALPLVQYFDKDRLYEIIAEFEADGCLVFDPHVYTIEDGGMKEIDHAQIDFKRLADPMGLMNPGKTRGWQGPSAA
jgi:FAD/FMN-containing dehydrogenase